MKKLLLILVSASFFPALSFCQVFEDSLRPKPFESHREDIENLLKKAERTVELEVEIASKQKQAVEEAPSIISVVTREEIENYGFRDLTDILRLVPGFEYGINFRLSKPK
jgi:outer membrane receptor protein involved in Fe transport